MTVTPPTGSYLFLLTVYVLAVTAINIVTFLISDFYRRKFGQTSPRVGFIVCVGTALILVASLFLPGQNRVSVRYVQLGLVLTASLTSMSSSLGLYFIMRKTRK